jgi:photosystem II stability/assembly factor-like uncharacterized protein
VVEALTSDCKWDEYPGCVGRGAARLWRYLPRRDSWIGSPAVEVSGAQNAELLLDPAQDVTYLHPLQGSPMLRTSDGGAHWTPVANPCSAMRVYANPSTVVSVVGGIDSATVSPSGALWAECGYGPFPGFNHVLYQTVSISHDQGASWGRVWSGSGSGIGPEAIAAFSATNAAMINDTDFYLSVTNDGGLVWNQTRAGFDEGTTGTFDILSPHKIWYFVLSDGAGGVSEPNPFGTLWFSDDGANFTKVA